MAWPKGVPRKKPESALPGPVVAEAVEVPKQAQKASGKPQWTMKAGNNWDGAVMEEELPDRLHIPRDQFPEGMDLQWVTETVFGQNMNRLTKFEKAGWTAVHTTDFNSQLDDGRFVPKGCNDFIKYEGLVLCARPLEISLERKRQERNAAIQQIRMKEQAFLAGGIDASGANHPSATKFNHISRSIERIDVPKD